MACGAPGQGTIRLHDAARGRASGRVFGPVFGRDVPYFRTFSARHEQVPAGGGPVLERWTDERERENTGAGPTVVCAAR